MHFDSTRIALMRAVLGGTWRRPGRILLAVLAIAAGVALGLGVALVNQSALAEFEHGMRTLSGSADLEIRAGREGFDEALYPRLARLPGVEVASPGLEISSRVDGQPATAPPLLLLGLDVFQHARLQPALFAAGAAANAQNSTTRGLLDADVVYLSAAAANWLHLAAGDTLLLKSGLAAVPLRVAGILPGGAVDERLAVADIATVQWRFGKLGSINRLDLRLAAGADAASLRAAIAALLPPGVSVATPDEAVGRAAEISAAYRVNLGMLAAIALVTGAFLVFSTQSLAVIRRRTEFALLLACGLTRRELVALLVAEGALLGLIGALLGLACGYLLAGAALHYLGGDLGAGMFAAERVRLQAGGASALLYGLLGVAAAAAGAWLPALEAASRPPALALKSGDEAHLFARLEHARGGLVCLALAAAALWLPGHAGIAVGAYLSVAFMLLGGVLLLPALARRLFARLPSRGGALMQLAAAQLAGAPGFVAVAGAGVLAAVALATAMAIMVGSFRTSLAHWLDHMLPADAYVRAARAYEAGGMDVATQEALLGTPGVARAVFVRHRQIMLDAARPPVALIARDLPADAGQALVLVAGSGAAPAGLPLWVSEAMVDLYGWRPGQVVELPLAGRAVTATVAGVWRDYARQQGAIMMRLADYRALTGDTAINEAGLWLAPGAQLAATAAALRARISGGERLDIVSPGAIRGLSLAIFDRTFAVTYALEAVAIVIGLAGIAASFAALAAARRREFGVLRHLGLTRRDIGRLLALEGLLGSALAVGLGLVLGGAIGWVLVAVINRESFHWSMDFAPDWLPLAGFALAMIAAGTAAARYAGRQAASADAVQAVKDDW
ncbi:MAG: ABC transporter permease [Rhodocyclaceae bacterium]|nr:ABC transporter permease [Rhodocyclaceae bacterium]MBX3667820.1 ABC transporter permease [Rhodocyclaceae bacterium]